MTRQILKSTRQKKEAVNIRMPIELRKQAQSLAKAQSNGGEKFTEADVYRTAIEVFLASNFTDSKDC